MVVVLPLAGNGWLRALASAASENARCKPFRKCALQTLPKMRVARRSQFSAIPKDAKRDRIFRHRRRHQHQNFRKCALRPDETPRDTQKNGATRAGRPGQRAFSEAVAGTAGPGQNKPPPWLRPRKARTQNFGTG